MKDQIITIIGKSVTLTLFLLCLGARSGFSQSNFAKGWILLQGTNDTLRGWVDFNATYQNGDLLFFKQTEQDNVYQSWNAQEVSIVQKQNTIYIGAVLVLDNSPLNIPRILEKEDIIPDTSSLFLTALMIAPDLSLLYCLDENHKEHFILQKDKIHFEELIYKRYKEDQYTGSTPTIKEDNQYKRQLQKAFGNCTQLESKIEKTRYNKKDLQTLFSTYLDCLGLPLLYINKREPMIMEQYLISGATMTRVYYTHRERVFIYTNQADWDYRPAFGAGLTVSPAKFSGRFGFSFEALLRSYKAQNISIDDSRLPFRTVYYLHLNTRQINNNVGFFFRTVNGWINPMVGAGLNISVGLTGKSTFEKEFSTSTTTEKTSISYVGNPRMSGAIFLQTGLTIRKRWNLLLRYESEKGYASYQFLESHLPSLYFLVSYKI